MTGTGGPAGWTSWNTGRPEDDTWVTENVADHVREGITLGFVTVSGATSRPSLGADGWVGSVAAPHLLLVTRERDSAHARGLADRYGVAVLHARIGWSALIDQAPAIRLATTTLRHEIAAGVRHPASIAHLARMWRNGAVTVPSVPWGDRSLDRPPVPSRWWSSRPASVARLVVTAVAGLAVVPWLAVDLCAGAVRAGWVSHPLAVTVAVVATIAAVLVGVGVGMAALSRIVGHWSEPEPVVALGMAGGVIVAALMALDAEALAPIRWAAPLVVAAVCGVALVTGCRPAFRLHLPDRPVSG